MTFEGKLGLTIEEYSQLGNLNPRMLPHVSAVRDEFRGRALPRVGDLITSINGIPLSGESDTFGKFKKVLDGSGGLSPSVSPLLGRSPATHAGTFACPWMRRS